MFRKPLGRNIESIGRGIGKLFGFGGGDGPPPNLSSYVNLKKYVSYTSTHQTGEKGQWNSNLGDQFKLKTYASLRIGEQKMFDINDTFFNGKDEGRNYQFNLGRYNLNYRPKDYRLRFMGPSDDHVSQGVSFGSDGIGYHYNFRGKNGRSGGFDAAFRPGGHTFLLLGKIALMFFQPETAPIIMEESAEESILIHYLAY